jgi:outer membrane protein
MAALMPGRSRLILAFRATELITNTLQIPIRSYKKMRLSLLSSLVAASVAVSTAHGADLLSLYREAVTQDPAVAAAQSALQAAKERVAQADAANGLSASLTAGASANYGDSRVRGLPSSIGQTDRGYLNGSVTAQVTKPLVRPANRVSSEQARASATLAEISLASAQQDLATRVSQAYFDVLLAQDNVTLVGAQKAAVAEQLAQARRNFEVGTATIVDTNEAQARFDQVLAQEIAATNELDRTRWALRNAECGDRRTAAGQHGALGDSCRARRLLGSTGAANAVGHRIRCEACANR